MVRTNVGGFFTGYGPPLIVGKSPLSLTEFGGQVAENLDSKNWAEDVGYKVWKNVQEMKDDEVHELLL